MLALLLSIVVALEVARRLPLLRTFRNLARVGARAPRIWAYRRGLEARKERATQLLAVRMFVCSVTAMWMIALVIAPIGLILLADLWLDLDVQKSLLNWRDRLVVAVLSLSYGLARIQIAHSIRRS